jgi:hypothetical protein
MEEAMKSLILSAVLGLSTLGPFAATAPDAHAAPRDRAWNRGYDGGYYGRGYYGGGYYGRGYRSGYYGGGYYYPSYDSGTSYYYPSTTTTQSYYYAPESASRYQYYWKNGWHMCYDNVTGQYWYESNGFWYLWQ